MRGALLCALSFGGLQAAAASCVASDPAATAGWLQSNQHLFYSKAPVAPADFLSDELLALLTKEWACREVCAIEADPWTGAQDGGVLPPLAFKVQRSRKNSASVVMTFRFGWRDSAAPPPTTKRTRLELTRRGAGDCWKLDDMKADEESLSLKETLRRYYQNAP